MEKRATLKGLVLAGGKSVRMGVDKGLIPWHGTAQRYYMASLLQHFCAGVFISCRQDQLPGIDAGYNTLIDTHEGLGPYGAILSAFEKYPGDAWLVTACDLPLLDAATLEFLIANRNTSKIATTFESPHDGLPEPLITIWEPSSFPVLLSFLSQGISCPRKALINSDVHIIKPPDPNALRNVNKPEEAEIVKQVIEKKTASF